MQTTRFDATQWVEISQRHSLKAPKITIKMNLRNRHRSFGTFNSYARQQTTRITAEFDDLFLKLGEASNRLVEYKLVICMNMSNQRHLLVLHQSLTSNLMFHFLSKLIKLLNSETRSPYSHATRRHGIINFRVAHHIRFPIPFFTSSARTHTPHSSLR